MSKYDFGYILEEGSTNEWAYAQIDENTKVLEIGPAIGNLTYHLCNEKKCKVDIIEIDEEAGVRAKQYANLALLGFERGDLDKFQWYKELKNERYDYIVGLDVLEHTKNPEKILELLRKLLCENGKIILSVPNLAHNAVIIKLIKNQFDYSDLGLLDRTHIHFFSRESIRKMVKKADLYVDKEDAIYKAPSDTELAESYETISCEMEQFLKQRKYAEVYQYLLVLKKNTDTAKVKKCESKYKGNLYITQVLVNGLLKDVEKNYCSLESGNICIDLSKYENVSSVRFVPIERDAIVYDIVAICRNEKEESEIVYNWTSGIELNKNVIVLSPFGREINYLIPLDTKELEIRFRAKLLNEDMIKLLTQSSHMEKEVLLEKELKEKQEIIDGNAILLQQKEDEIIENLFIIQEQEAYIKELQISYEELQKIKNTFLYRVMKKIKGGNKCGES